MPSPTSCGWRSSSSRRCQTSPGTMLHGCRPAPASTAPSLHRADDNHLGSSPRRSDQEFGTALPNDHQDNIVTLRIAQVRRASIAARSLLKPALTASQVSTCVGIAAPLLLRADVHLADLLRHLGWHGGCIVTLPTCSITSARPGASPSLQSTNFGDFGVTSRPASPC